jgi:geranylgeranyl diphosphate synthase type I
MEELAIYKDYVEIIEKELYAYLTRFNGPPHYYDYLLYHFGFKSLQTNGNGSHVSLRHLGKRLRPVMCLLIYKAITGNFKNVIPLVLSAEIMHNASLIHDDIQDHDELRWGRPTVWKLAGMEQGINFGDTLQAMAYGLILDLGKLGFDDTMITRIIASSNQVHITVVEGQYMDLQFEKRLDISEFEYFEMIAKKTATPYAGIAECAALLATGGKSQALIDAYKNFALKFGMLFQLTDDILGIWGDLWSTGKIPADIRNKKKTLPVIYALGKASPADKKILTSLYRGTDKIDQAGASEVLRILDETDAKALCQEWTRKFYEETLLALRETSVANAFQEKLRHMADYCYQRALLGKVPVND